MASYLSFYTLLLVIFNIVVTSKLSTSSRNHAYFSTNEDSHYIGENIPVTFHKDFSGTAGKISIDESIFNARIHLKFLPSILDFKERHLGIAHHERVTIINLSCNRTILMSSISGSTVHFHSSFFQDKIIPPLGNTSFSVVFLGREEGEVKSYLYIHTSEGSFKYQVRGESVRSPYRLRSFSGVKLPLNATYTPKINMHNPHPTVLQILEIYSSGSDFHLELPSGNFGGPKHIWQIPAFFTKPIIRLRFHASSPRNYSAYIRLKLDKDDQVIMIPIDVEVGSVYGLYSPDDLIDFGVGGTKDIPKKVRLFLKNTSKKPIKVTSVTTSPLTEAIKIDFKHISVPPRSINPVEVAVLSFDWDAAHKTGLTSGDIVVKSNLYNQKLTLKYQASVLEGGLEYDSSQLKFKSDKTEILPRLINIKNSFKVPVVITDISLRQSAVPYFEVQNFSSTTIFPGKTKPVFYLEAKQVFLNSNILMESGIHVYTNASTVILPLLCFSGKLKVISDLKANSTQYIGSVDVGEQKVFSFALINENPIPVHIKSLEVNISDAVIEIVAVERGNVTKALNAVYVGYNSHSEKELHLSPRSYCIVRVTLVGRDLGFSYGQVSVNTNFDTLSVDFSFKVIHRNDLKVLNPFEGIHHSNKGFHCPAKADFTFSPLYSKDSLHQEQGLGYFSSPDLMSFSEQYFFFDIWQSKLVTQLALFSNLTGPYLIFNSNHLPSLSEHLDLTLLIMRYENYLKLSSEIFKLSYWIHLANNTNGSLNDFEFTDLQLLPLIESEYLDFVPSYNSSYRNVARDRNYPVPEVPSKLIFEPSISSSKTSPRGNMSSPDYSNNNLKRQSTQSKIKLRKPGSYPLLLFELTERQLRSCEKNGNILPFMSVQRTFYARNTGSSPLNVVGFTINGHPCEAFGFKVIDCEPFILPGNSSKKIDMAFTPDFTLSKVTRLLTVLTLDSSVNYTLVATLPPFLLSECSSSITRPTWEPLVYYSAVSFMLFLLICVMGAAFFESNRILRNTIISLSRESNSQPVLDLRSIGSEPMIPAEQNSAQNELQCKIVWASNTYCEEQATKDNQKSSPDSIFSINCSNKCQILNNGINSKKKSERSVCKRYPEVSENYIEKTCWDPSFSRANTSQPIKSSICITTEPYIPLTNIKTSDSLLSKSDFSSSKFDQPRFIEFQRRRTKKKGQSLNHNFDLPKKKSVELSPLQNIFVESESSPTTSESSCSDEGEKDVESMFFQSVRHHLQSKVGRGRPTKLTNSSPLMRRKKSLEKSSVSTAENEWDGDDDENSEKTTVVRNNRRLTSSGTKQIKKQNNNLSKIKFDQSQPRGKQVLGERSVKCCVRKEKTQTSKKRNDKMEKRVLSSKGNTLLVNHEGVPPAPSPPVWTASFSDVVAGTEASYSSVVATKNNQTLAQNRKHQLNLCTQDSGSSCSGSSVTNFSAGWKTEYQDALEQQETTCESASGEMKLPLNNIWSNWSSFTEPITTQSNVLRASASSLFTDGPTQNNTYDPLWNHDIMMKTMQDSPEIDSFHGVRNEIHWPILTSLWEPLYTPSSTVETPPPVWGSDVWGPPVSPSTNQPSTEDVAQNNLDYDPFRSLSNIWAQHSPNIWKPPTSE